MMEKYNEAQEREYAKQGTCSLDAYEELANHLIDTLELLEKRIVLIARPRAFRMVFNDVRKRRETKNNYIIQPVPAKKNHAAEVIVCRAYEDKPKIYL